MDNGRQVTLLFDGHETHHTVWPGDDLLRIEVDAPEHVSEVVIRLGIPMVDVQGFWHPQQRTPCLQILWNIQIDAAAQKNFPFLSFFNRAQTNRGSIGLDNLIDDSRINARLNQAEGRYDICITVNNRPESGRWQLILDGRAKPWTQCLADYRTALSVPAPPPPPGAWAPVYCTWYAAHADFNQDWLEEQAAAATRLGFGTFIVDDGWCFPARKRVTPETISRWYEDLGPWTPAPEKFPDFSGHVARVQAMGLRYLLWVAPFLVGANTATRDALANALDPTGREGYFTLDVSNTNAARRIMDRIVDLVGRYGLDGLKIDFLDDYPPDISAPRGRAAHAFIRTLTDRVFALRQDALIEFRQSYATPIMRPYATQFRAGDVPYDYLDNFRRLVQLRLALGDGVPIHSDPAFWHPEELPANISRHMIAALAGVPMLSMDLRRLRPVERDIVSHWLRFYQTHLETLRTGRWTVAYSHGDVGYVSVSTPQETMVILCDEARLAESMSGHSGSVRMLNLTPTALAWPDGTAWTAEGNGASGGMIPEGGHGKRDPG